jgi:hypothetical protein
MSHDLSLGFPGAFSGNGSNQLTLVKGGESGERPMRFVNYSHYPHLPSVSCDYAVVSGALRYLASDPIAVGCEVTWAMPAEATGYHLEWYGYAPYRVEFDVTDAAVVFVGAVAHEHEACLAGGVIQVLKHLRKRHTDWFGPGVGRRHYQVAVPTSSIALPMLDAIGTMRRFSRVLDALRAVEGDLDTGGRGLSEIWLPYKRGHVVVPDSTALDVGEVLFARLWAGLPVLIVHQGNDCPWTGEVLESSHGSRSLDGSSIDELKAAVDRRYGTIPIIVDAPLQ